MLVEPETAINRKALSRALNPPITIRHFFQPKPSGTEEILTSAPDGVHSIASDVGTGPAERSVCGGVKRSVVGQSNKQRKLDFRVAAPTTPDSPIVIDDYSTCTEKPSMQQRGSLQDPANLFPKLKKFKGKSGTVVETNAAKPARVGITTVCPACGKELVMLTNLALNQHLDLCLSLEKASHSPST